MATLTKRVVNAIQPAPIERFAWDDGLPGFGLRVKQTGAKSFFVQYRNKNGRSRRVTLGRYGVLTVDQARTAARLALADVLRGVDPAEVRSQNRTAVTMADLCREYFDHAKRGVLITRRGHRKKASTLYSDQGRIERHIIPLLGRRTVRDLTMADLRGFLQSVIAGKTAADVKTKKHGRAIVRGGRGTAARTMGLLGAILSYAVEAGYRSDNPARGIVRPRDKRRRVRLDDDGYRLLGQLLAHARGAVASYCHYQGASA
jgi:hypothetical protein